MSACFVETENRYEFSKTKDMCINIRMFNKKVMSLERLGMVILTDGWT